MIIAEVAANDKSLKRIDESDEPRERILLASLAILGAARWIQNRNKAQEIVSEDKELPFELQDTPANHINQVYSQI